MKNLDTSFLVYAIKRAVFSFILLMIVTSWVYSRENSSQLYTQAAQLAQSGNIQEAIPLFEQVVKISPDFALGHYGLGKAFLYVEGRHKDSIAQLSKAVACDRRLARGYFYLGMAHMFAREYDRAIAAFSNAYALDKADSNALYNIAALYDITGRPLKALHYFHNYLKVRERGTGEFTE